MLRDTKILDNKILSEFSEKHYQYELLNRILYKELQLMIKEKNFFVMEISHRVKSTESLSGKLKRKSGKYTDLLDITDLCAARIICYFNDTVDKIADALRERFIVDEKNSVDKRTALNATQFGYLSLHYVVSLKPSNIYSQELCKIRSEIQIRTVLQHAWAEIEHDLGYKSEFGVPMPIRREFSRIAGLLEIADNQFSTLSQKVNAYEQTIRHQIAIGDCKELLLDEVTLREYTNNNEEFNAQIRLGLQQLGFDFLPTPVDRFIERLHWLHITTLGLLAECFKQNQHIIVQLIKLETEKYELDFVTTSMLFDTLCYAELMRSNYTAQQIRRFMEFSATTDEQIEDNLTEYYEVLKIVDLNKGAINLSSGIADKDEGAS